MFFRQLRARKTKFGFQGTSVRFEDVTVLAEIRDILGEYPTSEWQAKMVARIGGSIEVTIHTDNEELANRILGYV